MLADVPETCRAKQSVSDRVEDDVRVAMSGKPTRMRNLDPTHHDRSLAGESVNVEA